MKSLGSLLLWLTDHGYQVLVLGAVVAFCVRDLLTRRKVVRWLLIFGGLVVGSVFLAAAYGKMKPLPGLAWSWPSVKTSLAFFAMQVESYQLLSPGAANSVAHLLPFFELFLGLWLVSGIARRFSSVLASLAICGFMVAITSAYARGLKIDCGCGIGPPEEVGPGALLRDGLKFLLPALLVLVGAFWVRQSREEPAASEQAPSTKSAE